MVRRLCSTLSSPRRFGSGRARTTLSPSRQNSSITLSITVLSDLLNHQKTGAKKEDFVDGHVKASVLGYILCVCPASFFFLENFQAFPPLVAALLCSALLFSAARVARLHCCLVSAQTQFKTLPHFRYDPAPTAALPKDSWTIITLN